MAESAIKIEGLHFSYGKKNVLKGVDLEVPKGSIFGMVQSNMSKGNTCQGGRMARNTHNSLLKQKL